MRWIAMAEHIGFDATTIEVHFLPGTFKLSEIAERIADEIVKKGPVVLVIVDTSAAYFEEDNENDNVQMGNHAGVYAVWSSCRASLAWWCVVIQSSKPVLTTCCLAAVVHLSLKWTAT